MTIANNNLVIFHISSIDHAVTLLSLHGYTVVKVTLRNVDEAPIIEIDRPIDGYAITENKDKGIGYTEAHDCRIYWKLEVPHDQAQKIQPHEKPAAIRDRTARELGG